MTRKPLIYAAGPISNLTYEQATVWRDVLTDKLGDHFEVLSPMRDKEFLRDAGAIVGSYENNLFGRADFVMASDILDIERANAMVIYNPHPFRMSFGTPFEAGWAAKSQKPIICIFHQDEPLRKHPFILRCPFLIVVETLDECAVVLRHMFNIPKSSA